MRLPDKLTYGQAYDPAMRVKTKAEAQEYFEALVERAMRLTGKSRSEVEKIEKSNIAYWAGYGSTELRLRIEELFDCKHPVFGKAKDGVPTPEEAFDMGWKMAKARQDKGKAK